MSTAAPLTYEVEKSGDSATGRITTVVLHGRLVAENNAELKGLLKPLIAAGGRIVLNFSDVSYMDSSGLGALVVLKMSSINAGFGTLEFEHLSQRVQELLRLTNLTELFKS
jgi:anti-sigma B factor antagonist